ncbi:MAG: class I SAM-dependent methyltransferase [Candidatus Sumerlaeaceae bacterium]|nr:class I SAM-dependent methyltransferase [Candidatus Sumerlaeaceae bacterium]
MTDPRQGQGGYWDGNLDPNNLGAQFSRTRYNYPRELAFYLTPDQKCALMHMGEVKNKWTLDLGAGIGTNSLYLSRHGAKVIAADIALERLRALMAVNKGLPAKTGAIYPVRCAAEHLPFRRDSLDREYSKSVLIHTKLPRAVGELNRILKPEGHAVFVEPLAGNPLVNLYRATLAPKIWQQITTYFTRQELDVIANGMAAGEPRYFYLSAFLGFVWQFALPVPPLFRFSVSVLNAVDSAILRVFPRLRMRSWFVVIPAGKKTETPAVEG